MTQVADIDMGGEATGCELVARRLAPLTQQIVAELRGVDEDRHSAPTRVHDWWYFMRMRGSASSSQMFRFPVIDLASWTPPDPLTGQNVRMVLDFDADSPLPQATLGARTISPDSRSLAWTYDPLGDERFVVVVRDLDLGTDRIVARDVGMSVAWSPSSDALFTTTLDAQWRPHRITRHPLDGGAPTLCFEEADERYAVRVSLSRSGQYVLLHSASNDATEVRIAEDGHTAVLVSRSEGRLCAVDHVLRADGRSEFLALHNGKTGSFSLGRVSMPASEGDPALWTELSAPDDEVRLTHLVSFSTFDLLVGTRGPEPVYFTRSEQGGQVRQIDIAKLLDRPVSLTLEPNDSADQPYVRFHASSFSRPPFTVDYAPADDELFDRGAAATSDAVTSDAVTISERTVWATGADGQPIPITVLSSEVDGTAGPGPAVLFGYGAYGVAIRSIYDPARIPYLRRGVVYAIAHVRGGGEFGPSWHAQGRGLNKPVAVSDFLACANALVDAGITERGRILAAGASAGGTLVAAALNQEPDLFAGVLASVPFVDPLGSMLDPSLPFTIRDRAEWGDPVHHPEAHACLASYSPLQNVHAAAYPPVWCSAATNDVRVPLYGPAQWIQSLRACSTSGAPAHLRVHENSGHQSAVGHIEERSLETAWALDVLEVATPGTGT